MCPAADGGYTLLALPADAPPAAAFDGVRWSASDTCLSQLATLSRAGLRCVVGPTYADVDDAADLRALRQRLGDTPEEACRRTVAVLDELAVAGALDRHDEMLRGRSRRPVMWTAVVMYVYGKRASYGAVPAGRRALEWGGEELHLAPRDAEHVAHRSAAPRPRRGGRCRWPSRS